MGPCDLTSRLSGVVDSVTHLTMMSVKPIIDLG